MEEKGSTLKGGVIVIGSLFWESEQNCLPNDEKGAMRRTWRENNLDLDKAIDVPLPIRYGRSSSSRKCTYTMVFSKECQNAKIGQGKVIPFKEEFDLSNYQTFERQVTNLAKVEGIYKQKKKFSADWGTVSIWINPLSKSKEKIVQFWNSIKSVDHGFKQNTNHYKRLDGKLLDDNYCLSFEISTTLDFLLCTYIKAEHKNSQKDQNGEYPTIEEIANEINTSGYSTYFDQNNGNGIITFQDNEIKQLLINR